MAKGKLFEYVILHHPKTTKEMAERSETAKSVLVKGPTSVLAGSEQEVQITAARAITPEHMEHLEDIEITIRPF